MGPGFSRGIAEGLILIGAILFAAGVALACLLIFGVPWLWGLLKPWLHQVTS